jgi:hypothetical protein
MKLKLGFLMLVLTLMGCSNDNEKLSNEDAANAFFMKLESLSLSYIDENNFPEWLLLKIDEIETIHSKDISIVKVKILQGEWNKQIVYFIKDNLKSCLLCEVYYENGENVVFNENLVEDFCTSSKNWKLIYEYGGKDDEQGNVPYNPCLCEGQEQKLADIFISPDVVYLFKDSIPKQIEKNMYDNIYQPENEDGLKWIIYDSETDIAHIYHGIGVFMMIYKICNFPDFAKKWDIPQNGQLVYFKGITYQACNPPGGIATVSYFDFVLTHLEIK